MTNLRVPCVCCQNMAVSNAIGSNVFDICLGIGLPYFVKTALVSPGETVPCVQPQCLAQPPI